MRLTKNGLIVTAIVSVGLANFFGVDEWISPQENMDPSHPQGMKIEDEHAELIFLQPFPQPVLRFGGIFYAFTQGGRLERIRLLDIQNATKESGISDMTRIKLNLDRKQQRTLKFDLEKQVKKTSFQLYPFISSHSKVLELLETQTNTEVPILANKSSTLTLTAIKASKLMGNELYGEIIEVQAEESKTPNNLIRSALVPYVELSFLYRYAPSVLAVDFILPKEKAE